MADDLLSPLGDGPVPPLAPAAVVRARGEQRRRRRRTALAGTAALSLVLVGFAGVAMSQPQRTDELRPEPFATQAPRLEDEPLQAALLDPQDVADVIGGRWVVRPTDDIPFDVRPSGCGEVAAPGNLTALRYLDGPEGRAVGEHLSLHDDDAVAQDAYARTLAALGRCGESSPAYSVFEIDGDRAYGQVVDGGALRPFSVQQVGRAVVTVVEQGPMDASRALADASAREVRAALGDTAPAPTSQSARVTPQQLLDGPSVEAVLGGSWSTLPDLRENVYAPYICAEGPPAAVAGLSRSLESAGGQHVGSQVLAFPDEPTATDVHAQLRADVDRCPTRPDDSEDGRATVSHHLVPGPQESGDRFYLRSTSRDCNECPEREGVAAVARVGQWLVLVEAGPDLEADLPRLADAAVARAGGTGPASPSAEPGRDFWLPDAFLSPEAAAQAEMAGWRVDADHVPEDATTAADPCADATIPLDSEIRDQGERAMSSEREAGGSSLLQEVYRYSSATAAAQAFAEYEQRYIRCADVQDPNAGEGWMIRSSVVDREVTPDGGRLLVRRIPCAPEGYCADHFATYAMVVREANGLSAVAYTIAEDGDPAQEAQALVQAVQQQLRSAVSP